VVIQLASDLRIERKKKPSALAGDWIAEIHPNIGATTAILGTRSGGRPYRSFKFSGLLYDSQTFP
jgi:hypothetical protein